VITRDDARGPKRSEGNDKGPCVAEGHRRGHVNYPRATSPAHVHHAAGLNRGATGFSGFLKVGCGSAFQIWNVGGDPTSCARRFCSVRQEAGGRSSVSQRSKDPARAQRIYKKSSGAVRSKVP
jgi:hypothetical protein